MHNPSRRDFLKKSAATSVAMPLLGTLLAMQEASAGTSPSDYKALVCVYLAGGNDAYNTLVYGANHPSRPVYEAKRSQIHLATSQLLELGEGGQNMALNHQLPNLHQWFGGQNGMNAAIVANVGPLVKPLTQSQYAANNTADRPPQLFSHNDQTSIWLTGKLEGRATGWGGGMLSSIDETVPAAAADFRSISVSKQSAFCAASAVGNFVADPRKGILPPGKWADSPLPEHGIRHRGRIGPDASFLVPLLKGTHGMSTVNSTYGAHLIEKDYVRLATQAYNNYLYLKADPNVGARLPDAPTLEQPLADNPLLRQLAMVATTIKQSAQIQVKRQVFFVELGGFDTHNGQARGGAGSLSPHDRLLKQLDEALSWFYADLGDAYKDSVTTFTASEFGRKLVENGDGSDHGWGGHHFVVGGSQVKSGQIFGRVPTLDAALTDPQLVGLDGTLIPSVSVQQFGWELARWFDVPAGQQATVFPGYTAPVSGVDVSFMV